MVGDEHRTEGGLTVRFWGTRGSLPRSGPDFMRYGGNTTCVEIRLGKRLFIIDAGSGIADAGRSMLDDLPRGYDILLSHLHHDHTIGLPFFAPALKPDCNIRLHCGNLDGESAEAALGTMFAPPIFPVRLSVLPCRFTYHGFRAGTSLAFEDGTLIRTCPLIHPGGATGYRFDHGGRSVCYISDLEHSPGMVDKALVSFCTYADLVIYDAMFDDAEFQACRGWGHSTWAAGIALCKAAGAKALAATHHHLRHTDAILDETDRKIRSALPGSFVARDGLTVSLEARVAEPAF